MGKRKIPDKINRPEYRAKICMDLILEFREQHENIDGIERKLSEYNIQQLRCYIQKYICTKI